MHHQREEELSGELAISDPGLSGGVALEGSDIDEHRLSLYELDVERGRVLDRDAVVESAPEEPQLQQGSVLQHRERPLVRVGDEVQNRMLQSGRPAVICERGRNQVA